MEELASAEEEGRSDHIRDRSSHYLYPHSGVDTADCGVGILREPHDLGGLRDLGRLPRAADAGVCVLQYDTSLRQALADVVHPQSARHTEGSGTDHTATGHGVSR